MNGTNLKELRTRKQFDICSSPADRLNGMLCLGVAPHTVVRWPAWGSTSVTSLNCQVRQALRSSSEHLWRRAEILWQLGRLQLQFKTVIFQISKDFLRIWQYIHQLEPTPFVQSHGRLLSAGGAKDDVLVFLVSGEQYELVW